MKFLKISLLLLVPLSLLALFAVLVTGAASYRVYVIHTGSMSPHIPSGSAVLVHEGHYHIGQVVTFTEDGLTVTHRLVAIDSNGIITTKGDSNATNDPWHVPKSQIIGGVVVAPRYVGYWIMYLKNPLGLASVLLAALALWQIWSLTSSEDQSAKARRRPAHRRSRRSVAPVVVIPPTVSNLAMAAEGPAAEIDEESPATYPELIGAVKGGNPTRDVDVS